MYATAAATTVQQEKRSDGLFLRRADEQYQSDTCRTGLTGSFFYLPAFNRDYMNLSYQNPAFVIVILWGIAIFTTTFLFMGSVNLTSGIVIQGVCMIGSAVYLRKTGETCRTQKQEI